LNWREKMVNKKKETKEKKKKEEEEWTKYERAGTR
jgi:hypothetical protein